MDLKPTGTHIIQPWLTLKAPVQQRGVDAWQRAVAVAIHQIETKGFGYLSLHTVAAEAKVPYRTLQRWFQNKVGLGLVASAVMMGTGQLTPDQAHVVQVFLVGKPR